MNLDAVCQEGAFVVENVSYYADASVGVELTPEADWKRRGLYIGPQVSCDSSFESFSSSGELI